jgi:hypothetical protein
MWQGDTEHVLPARLARRELPESSHQGSAVEPAEFTAAVVPGNNNPSNMLALVRVHKSVFRAFCAAEHIIESFQVEDWVTNRCFLRAAHKSAADIKLSTTPRA